VDFKYLEDFTRGDASVVREVLQLFLGQAAIWTNGLSADQADWRDTIHTIKGAARGIGAVALGDICAQAEAEGALRLNDVLAELDMTTTAIGTYLDR
jgi:HPt (histidine-containing phosphotransfer) domain-containing protein